MELYHQTKNVTEIRDNGTTTSKVSETVKNLYKINYVSPNSVKICKI